MRVGGVRSSSGRSWGRVRGVRTPTFRPDACLRLTFLHRKDRISLFNWLIFLMKRVLHFATKLNSKDIQKYDCFWVPFYDLLVSAAKHYFPRRQRPAFTDWETRSRLCLLSDWWEGVWGCVGGGGGALFCPPKVQYLLSEPKFGPPPPPIKNSWIRPWVGYAFIRQRPMTPLCSIAD